ncbi:MAG: SUMF1/EgtB/PvdO family nonheme iron enzyme [Bacteroidota bacterium]
MKSILSSLLVMLVLQPAIAQRKYNLTDCGILGFDMVRVEGGTFDMGDDNDGADRKPAHTVKLRTFDMAVYEVKQAQWKDVMGTNPSAYCCNECPVTNVSWDEVQDFIKKLNAKSGRNYRLPTEAEWEYAARGGGSERLIKEGKMVRGGVNEFLVCDKNTRKPEKFKTGKRFAGKNGAQPIAWYEANSWQRPHEVGRKKSNDLGIYDMSGNAEEWTADWYATTYGSRDTVENPTGPAGGKAKVVRGGSYLSPSFELSVTRRAAYLPNTRARNLGFRVVEVK